MNMEHVQPYLSGPGICIDPVFVIGSPRSGTTAMAHSLGQHPELRVGKESYVLSDLFKDERAERVWGNHQGRVTPCWIADEGVELDEWLAFVGLGFNALFTSRSGGKRWIDQTPLYTPMASTLSKMFPGARFVHIVRDGRHVVRSMIAFEQRFDSQVLARAKDHEIPQWRNDLEKAASTWSKWVHAGLDFCEAAPDRCLTIRNEDVSANPDAHFERILDFLALPRNSDCGDFFAKRRIASSYEMEPARPGDDEWPGWDREGRGVLAKVARSAWVRAGYGTATALDEWARG